MVWAAWLLGGASSIARTCSNAGSVAASVDKGSMAAGGWHCRRLLRWLLLPSAPPARAALPVRLLQEAQALHCTWDGRRWRLGEAAACAAPRDGAACRHARHVAGVASCGVTTLHPPLPSSRPRRDPGIDTTCVILHSTLRIAAAEQLSPGAVRTFGGRKDGCVQGCSGNRRYAIWRN